MELFIILIPILFFWGVARFFGMVFNGPRHRRRKARRYIRDGIAYEADIYARMRRARDDRRYRW